jgi:hypothetical protein
LARSRQTGGVAVVMTGHVTKDGDVAGRRTLEHAVAVVLTFDGDPRSGLRVLSGSKSRFGAEGEITWFEMQEDGLAAIDPAGVLLSGDDHPGEDHPGAAVALPRTGHRAIAVEVQALVVPGEGPPRRQATGLDPRRFQLVAAVLDRAAGLPLARSELFGAAAGGVKVGDPACDLAVAAARPRPRREWRRRPHRVRRRGHAYRSRAVGGGDVTTAVGRQGRRCSQGRRARGLRLDRRRYDHAGSRRRTGDRMGRPPGHPLRRRSNGLERK